MTSFLTDRFRRARLLLLVCTGLMAILVSGCSGDSSDQQEPNRQSGQDPLKVTVSIAPQASFVKAIGGPNVDVTVMVPPGSEPATYEPKAKQVATLSQSAAYFSVGVPFEKAWLPRFRSAAEDLRVVETTDGVSREALSGGQPDPHIWLSPTRVAQQGRNYADALTELDPAHADDYENGLKEFQDTVAKVDSDLSTMLKPYAGKSFMIFHPVLNYFAEDYNLKPINIELEGDEPSAADMRRLVEAGRDRGISAVLVEPQFAQKSARTIADQLGVPVEEVNPLATDWDQNMLTIGQTLVSSFKTST